MQNKTNKVHKQGHTMDNKNDGGGIKCYRL